MRFSSPLVQGRFLRRYKRFFADVRLDDGRTVTAHCANSGTMKTCLEPEGQVWLTHHDDPKRKLAYTWVLSEVKDAIVFVHPAQANALVREGIETNVISELTGYDRVIAESRVGEHTRIDFLLTKGNLNHYVEVKSATLSLDSGRSAFPDAVSTRASKHLRELIELRQKGHKSTLIFCASRTDAESVEPADDIDAEYGKNLRLAASEGVQILAYGITVDLNGSEPSILLSSRLPVELRPNLSHSPKEMPQIVSKPRRR